MSFSQLLAQVRHDSPDKDSSAIGGGGSRSSTNKDNNNTKSSNNARKGTSSSSTTSTPNSKNSHDKRNDNVDKYSLSYEERQRQQEQVQRLKEARRLEQNKKNAAAAAAAAQAVVQAAAKKSINTSTSKSSRLSSATKGSNRRSSSTAGAATPPPGRIQAEPSEQSKRKLNFREIMAAAEQVDPAKLRMDIKVKEPSQRPAKRIRSASEQPKIGATKAPTPSLSSSSSLIGSKHPSVPRKAAAPTKSRPAKQQPKQTNTTSKDQRASISFARPMESLAKKQKEIKKRKGDHSRGQLYQQQDGYDEDELDDFIVSDEDEQDQQLDRGYDREEIWRIMHGGRAPPPYSRQYYDEEDEDDDDMEATGEELLREEFRSTLAGRREDELEEEEERQRAQAKRMRRLKQHK